MALAKIETSIGVTICLGVCKVLHDSNGNVRSGTRKSKYGEARLKFKVMGTNASRKMTRKDGVEYWKNQKLWCSVETTDPLVQIVKTLNEGDIIDIWGVTQKSPYIDDNTGRERTSLFCNLERIYIIARADGTTPTATNDCEDTQDDDDNWSDL